MTVEGKDKHNVNIEKLHIMFLRNQEKLLIRNRSLICDLSTSTINSTNRQSQLWLL